MFSFIYLFISSVDATLRNTHHLFLITSTAISLQMIFMTYSMQTQNLTSSSAFIWQRFHEYVVQEHQEILCGCLTALLLFENYGNQVTKIAVKIIEKLLNKSH